VGGSIESQLVRAIDSNHERTRSSQNGRVTENEHPPAAIGRRHAVLQMIPAAPARDKGASIRRIPQQPIPDPP